MSFRELEFALVRGEGQEMAGTRSRGVQPRGWLPVVEWLVGAGLHPRAGEMTLRVARDLAGRMDYRRGWVLYALDGMVQRLGVSRATVKRHVQVLRELGALVWVRHGSKRNLRLPGRAYAGTATIYAAVIPPVYDTAMGHRVEGEGYQARRIGVTDDGREGAVAEAREKAETSTPKPVEPVDNSTSGPVDNSGPVEGSSGREPHSRMLSTYVRKDALGSELKYTSRTRARPETSSPSPSKPLRSHRGKGRSPLQVARDITIARKVRPLVPWTQTEGLRRLAYALRPLIDAGQGVQGIAAELYAWRYSNGVGHTWRPGNPAAFIGSQLSNRGLAQTSSAPADASCPQQMLRAEQSPSWQAFTQHRTAVSELQQMIAEANTPARTDQGRARARSAGNRDPHRIAAHYYQDEDDAYDLYGWELVSWAVRAAESSTIHYTQWGT